MNLYLRYFDKETLVHNVDEALDFLRSIGIMFWGSSFVAGPQGEFLFRASNNEEVETIVEVDMKRSENVRRWWPFLRDRRIDYYDGITKRFLD